MSLSLSPLIRNVVFSGYSLPFREFPPVFCLRNNRSAIEHASFVDDEISQLCSIGSVVRVDEPPIGVNPLAVAVQGEGKKRLILDRSFLNGFLVSYKFKLENMKNVLNFVLKGSFLAKLDLKSGCHHVHISENHQKYLGFLWNENYYQYSLVSTVSHTPVWGVDRAFPFYEVA